MQKYIYVKSPMIAAHLLDRGFSYMRVPFGSTNPVFIFSFNDAIIQCLEEECIVGQDYVVRDGAVINF